jgi:hypothetical protein
MEGMPQPPADPREALVLAEDARRRLTEGLRLPTWFHTSLGVAIAVQIGTAAYGVAGQTAPRMLVLVAGCLVFVVVAAGQVVRFRSLNRVRIDGLVSRAVLGSSPRSWLAYGAGFAGSTWAAFEGRPWVATLAAVAGGAGYALSSRLWWQAYVRDPAGHARAESLATRVLYGVLGVAGLVVLLVLR